MTDEKELIFRRFPEDKQEQIRQLVAYTTLMGLSGKDLVSIGGKLNRIEEKNQALNLIQIAQGYESSCVVFGKTDEGRKASTGRRWTYTDANRSKWTFTTQSLWNIEIYSHNTKKTKRFYINSEIPQGVRRQCNGKSFMYNALIALHTGQIKLNF